MFLGIKFGEGVVVLIKGAVAPVEEDVGAVEVYSYSQIITRQLSRRGKRLHLQSGRLVGDQWPGTGSEPRGRLCIPQ